MEAPYSSLYAWFSQFEKAGLLSLLSRLQMEPRNQYHLVRLERATQLATATALGKRKLPSFPILIQRLNSDKFLAQIASAQDPPENLFTENLVFIGGNYVVYPGIADRSAYILRHLLEGLFHYGRVDRQFLRAISAPIRAVLTLSNHLAQALGHSRYMNSPAEVTDRILPPSHDSQQTFHAARFDSTELAALLAKHDLSLDALSPFTLGSGVAAPSEAAKMDNHPLQARPILEIGGTYVVGLPCSLASAIRHFIVLSAQNSGCLDDVIKAYQDSIQEGTAEALRLMRFRRLQIQIPDGPPTRRLT